ncbi:hypothetical protein [Chitiniphilus shinanonensis]|uniref:hypothetical protein n=1 Tax=Chitiniphilus shinanonensis TaxID=553088 RepID=UPI003058E03B
MVVKRIVVCLLGALLGGAIFLPFLFGEIDFWRLSNHEEPIFARFRAAAADGGTMWYEGFGYDLFNMYAFVDGQISKCTVGPAIHYSTPIHIVSDHQNVKIQDC